MNLPQSHPAIGETSSRALRVGDPAPNFQARTTRGPVELRDYRGQWLLLFSHPADFTPVCTSEFIAFARETTRFDEYNCALLGLSVDSLYSHIAWIEAIKVAFGVSVTFPIIEDPSMTIAEGYGMIDRLDPNSASVRAVYFIDPDGVIRAMIWYPLSIGRSVDEILRVLAALQRTAEGSVLAPEGWRPGQALLCPGPQNSAELAEANSGAAWFYRECADQ